MKKNRALCAGLFALGVGYGAFAEDLKPYALIVMLDGMRADMARVADMPYLRSVIDGKWHPDYKCASSLAGQNLDDAMTYSYANHSSIICGVKRVKHNVAFNCDVGIGNFKRWPSWQTLVVRNRPGVKALFCTDGEPPIAKDNATIEWVAAGAKAAAVLSDRLGESDAPQALSLFLEDPDAAGHGSGYFPSGDNYLAMCSTNDMRLAKVLEAIRRRPTFAREDWLIMLTADHGGIHQMHGEMDAHTRTVPIILCGRHVVQGTLAGLPRNYDLAATALRHFGLDPKVFELDGEPIGSILSPVRTAGNLAESMCLYFPFSPQLAGSCKMSTRNAVSGGWTNERVGDPTYLNFSVPKDGVVGECAWIGGESGSVNAIRFAGTETDFRGADGSFSFAFWIREELARSADEQASIFGNMDIASPRSPGFQLVGNVKQLRCKRGVCLEYLQGDGTRKLMGPYFLDDFKWKFLAMTVSGDGVVMFYGGGLDGRLHSMAGDGRGARFVSGLPIHLGQDGTGRYGHNFNGFLDELAFWKRALSDAEIQSLYRAGLKHESPFSQSSGKPGFETWRATDHSAEAGSKK